ncbi:type II secretion system F family protein [Halomonas beimenensis]|uniref:Type II/IV secretion system protein TadC, associated with Flp pilus assembly n=1 Tax=Halomonas beimenensis TaxID=475662 RepID=A0A291P8F6_9GAMM|nr:type II secretion system F family protein [Halomonas beimenensis]ATJ83165.1 type II/IV secretion system protein TadC, associated with Flp pilus assembly [Halomonas beimenensis]
MTLLLTSSLLTLVAAALCLRLARLVRSPRRGPRVSSGVADHRRQAAALEARLLGGGRVLWRRQTSDRPWLAELALMLRQAGYIGSRAQLYLLFANALIVFGVFSGGVLYGMQLGLAWPRVLVAGLAFAGAAAVMVWLWLKRCRQRRVARLDEEADMVIQVTRMLWESGMTLEGVLRGLIHNLDEACPESVRELRLVLLRIEAGQAREEVLEDLAAIQPSEGLEDLLKLLAQISASGGGARRALLDLGHRLRDRRRLRIQEAVSSLSGKMSLVMMVFLFPALLIVLAGPAVINLGGMLGNLGS